MMSHFALRSHRAHGALLIKHLGSLKEKLVSRLGGLDQNLLLLFVLLHRIQEALS